ncbi:hypothetical protein J2Y55_001106 [Bosea sp. BE125]|uniref:hypothetical protein n=1 Tax=Bosea sp. BE125 TaxID=2817909 RepID=UPI00285BCF96|nr:hypothetical protein [Bosea sp. BE125]MDR6870106.1 hypothetical protein [Bosea sp. BE125]
MNRDYSTRVSSSISSGIMLLEHVEFADLAGFVIGSDMNHHHALGRAPEPQALIQGMALRLRKNAFARCQALAVRLEGLEKERLDIGHGLTPKASLFSLCSHFLRAGAMVAERLKDTDPATEIECEIDDLVAEHGSERAALRAVLHDMTVLLADAHRSVSHGYLRGLFSSGARPAVPDEEP